MPTYSETRELPFSPEQMFDVALGVEHYPDFLPWCVSTRINAKTDNEMSADMAVGFTVFRETYTSHVTFERPYHIHVTDTNGPFEHLETDWRFEPASSGGGCTVHFEIDFAFRSILLEKAIGKVFEDATHKMVGAFVKRAEVLYGQQG